MKKKNRIISFVIYNFYMSYFSKLFPSCLPASSITSFLSFSLKWKKEIMIVFPFII